MFKMKKLLNIPYELEQPLLILAAKKNKGNLHAFIIDILSKAVDESKPKSNK